MLDAIKRRLYEHLTHRRGQEKIRQLRGHLQTPDPIVLVHQMGRAGSMTTVGTLERADLGMPVFHSHSLNPRNVQRRVTYFAGRRRAENRYPLNVQVSRVLGGAIQRGGVAQRDWHIVSVFRDPAGRNLSVFFLMIDEYIENFHRRHAAGEIDDAYVLDVFLKKFPHHEPIAWFDEEIRDVFGIDVYAQPFPSEDGYQILRKGNVSLLLIRVEDLDTCHAAAFGDFLGIDAPPLRKLHISERKSSKQVYRSFLQNVKLPVTVLDQMYDSRYARHFYSPDDITRFRQRWGGKPVRLDTDSFQRSRTAV